MPGALALVLAAACAAAPSATPKAVTSSGSIAAPTLLPVSAPVTHAPRRVAALRAIEFLSATQGVGLAAGRPPALAPTLVVTNDGGIRWRVEGVPVPVTSGSPSPSLAFASETVGLVDVGRRLFATSDGGETWRAVGVGGAVAAIASWRDSLWALVVGCPVGSGPDSPRCLLRMGTTTVGRGGGVSWRSHPLPIRGLPEAEPSLSRLGFSSAMVTGLLWPDLPADPVLVTTDGGVHWSVRASPCASPPPVRVGGGRTTRKYWMGSGSLTGSRAGHQDRWWLMCDGGASAGTQTKGVERSVSMGDAWAQVASFPFIRPWSNQGHLPTGDDGVLIAVSPSRLWLTDANGLAGSGDGGRTWTTVRGVDLGGLGPFSSFSFVDSRHGWLLAPGRGLWRTVDGRHWTLVE